MVLGFRVWGRKPSTLNPQLLGPPDSVHSSTPIGMVGPTAVRMPVINLVCGRVEGLLGSFGGVGGALRFFSSPKP